LKLHTVTITGADDSTDISQLVDLSAEFQFVEWAILVSKRQEGSSRFPSRAWIDRFAITATNNNLKVATHICGRWVRELFCGELAWIDLPASVEVSQRVQINIHAEPHVSTVAMFSNLLARGEKTFIFQWDGVNDHLAFAAREYGLESAALFDTSGGAGVLPSEGWRAPSVTVSCGFAGGLGPTNIEDQVKLISSACPPDYSTWVDMERRVRTDDDSRLDMSRVRKVLEAVRSAGWVN
jgi:phosphoribosylanthranilate isomerase